MNAKQYLERYRYLPHEIESLLLAIREQKELATSIRSIDYSKDKIQVSTGNEAEFEARIIRAMDLERESLEKIDEFYQVRANCEMLINNVFNPLQRTILKYKYINGKTREEIAKELGFTRQWIDEQMSRGLQLIEVIADKKKIKL